MRKYPLGSGAQRARVEVALRGIGEHSERPEQSCAYRLDFAAGGERVVVKQYTSGTLFLQGAGPEGPLFRRLTDAVETAGVASAPLGKSPSATSRAPRGASVGVDVRRPFATPWIGSDESGKGDYFGPLVVAAVWVDDRVLALLETLGVQDSKALSDAQNRRLALDVRAVCLDPAGNRCAEVVLSPERYNQLYDQFRREGKNLNTLLAWQHARAIETVLERVPAANAIVDQFADARYIKERLASRAGTRELNIVQMPKAEANLAVAAASVLARDGFLNWLASAERRYGLPLPKGASNEVEAAARRFVTRHGRDALSAVAKLHFKTTLRVVSYQPPLAASPDSPPAPAPSLPV
ncbi:MAG TPA: ribonuclease HIII [Chloroflexota bacterium]|nr:ribonuclease HIII [Chloroflexota bacterium]